MEYFYTRGEQRLMIYLTSDNHFGHQNIIEFCNRPFFSADDMDETLIENINATVGPQDELWHLGDFSFRSTHSIKYYLDKIKCRIHIVFGSHDKEAIENRNLFASSHFGIKQLKVNKEKIVLCHHPLLSWDARHHGRLHFFGHVHSSDKSPFICQRNSCDIGVDAWDFTSVSLEDAIVRAKDNYGKLTVHDKYDTSIIG